MNRAAEHLYEWEEWPLASNKNEKFVEFCVCVGGVRVASSAADE